MITTANNMYVKYPTDHSRATSNSALSTTKHKMPKLLTHTYRRSTDRRPPKQWRREQILTHQATRDILFRSPRSPNANGKFKLLDHSTELPCSSTTEQRIWKEATPLTTGTQQRNALAIQTAFALGDGQQTGYSSSFRASRRQNLFYSPDWLT